MARRERELKIQILGDAGGATKAFAEVERAGAGFGKKMMGVAGVASGALAAIGIDRVVESVVDFGQKSLTAFREAEASAAKLEAAFAKSPKLVGANVKEFEKLNEELATKTKFDDDATASGQAVLAQFGLTAEELKALTPLMQDYASWTGKDLPTAAEDLGKAVLGQGRALKELGIEFNDTGTAAGNLDQLMSSLNSKVGGFAEKEGKTSAGQAAILSNRFGELQEAIGSKLAPVLERLTKWFSESVVPWLERSWAAIKEKVVPAFEDLRKKIDENRPQLEKFGEWVATVAEWIGTKLAPALAVFMVEGLGRLVTYIGNAVEGFETMKNTFERIIGTMRSIATSFVNFFTQSVIEPILRGIEKVTDAYDSLPAWARGDKINFNAPDIPVVGPSRSGGGSPVLMQSANAAEITPYQTNITVNAGTIIPADDFYEKLREKAATAARLQQLVGVR